MYADISQNLVWEQTSSFRFTHGFIDNEDGKAALYHLQSISSLPYTDDSWQIKNVLILILSILVGFPCSLKLGWLLYGLWVQSRINTSLWLILSHLIGHFFSALGASFQIALNSSCQYDSPLLSYSLILQFIMCSNNLRHSLFFCCHANFIFCTYNYRWQHICLFFSPSILIRSLGHNFLCYCTVELSTGTLITSERIMCYN